MTLPDRFASDFAADVQSRGREYFRSGEVRILRADARGILARVRGSALYKVEFDFYEDGDWQGECSCPFNQDRLEPCKHMWATLLEAAAQGRLAGAERIDPPPRAARSFNGDSQAETKVPKWKRQLIDVREQMLEQQRCQLVTTASKSPAVQSGQWPPDRRLIYLIDGHQTLRGGMGLVIELGTEKLRSGRWERLKRFQLEIDQWLAVPNEDDRTIAQMLVGSQEFGMHYNMPSPGGGKRFVLSPASYDTTLKRICLTGRCRVKRHEEDEDPQPVEWDDGPEWEFRLRLTPREGSARCTLSGELVRPGAMQNAEGGMHNGEMTNDARETMPITEPVAVIGGAGGGGGILIARGKVSRLNHFGAWALLAAMRTESGGNWLAPIGEPMELIRELADLPALPPIELPENLGVRQVRTSPRPRLLVRRARETWAAHAIIGDLAYEYDGTIIGPEKIDRIVLDHGGVSDRRAGDGDSGEGGGGRLIHRDVRAEQAAAKRLMDLGFKSQWDADAGDMKLVLPVRRLAGVVAALTGEGWHIEAEGKLYRMPGAMQVHVSSGIDWFDVTADVDFGGQRVPLPKLLAAMTKGDGLVTLDDGTMGILPDAWLRKYGGIVSLGIPAGEEGDALRFTQAQAGLLDVLLAAMPEARVDEVFANARKQLRQFEKIEPADAPQTFVGELRPYQREGLGWLEFLQKFGFGGCLADDMGLGKTVQVLALLEKRRQGRAGVGYRVSGIGDALPPTPDTRHPIPASAPSLVVVPRSLVFNWKAEANRFCPQLRVLDHSGPARERETTDHLSDYDVILTTYGTLRRDAALFRDFVFDYAILDEAQSIKNASSESAKAARLIRARHRLAMSGTPIENHLGELWSLFEFLNPGMLGRAGAFKQLQQLPISNCPLPIEEQDEQLPIADGQLPIANFQLPIEGEKHADSNRQSAIGDRQSDDPRQLIAAAVRPFILRRTKAQVARELPEKMEQTIFCQLDPPQRQLYDELKDHYRQALLGDAGGGGGLLEIAGLGKSKIQILEALLRLRQAACHPGLIDPARARAGAGGGAGESSAKLQTLLEHLDEVVEEGHKVLVFSQFVSFLTIVRQALDARGLTYEYLDGQTRDRQQRVERFQSDPAVKIFLISLKAGGLGLNLTEANYVFLLDPWWNPATEAQAIDRAHRIGQSKSVFAYRLIAKDTVEEKVLELQAHKRELADAIINADNSLIGKLGREDLERLLS